MKIKKASQQQKQQRKEQINRAVGNKNDRWRGNNEQKSTKKTGQKKTLKKHVTGKAQAATGSFG